MSLDARPRTVPFDPGLDSAPLALDRLFDPSSGALPALLLVAGPVARRSGWAGRAAVALADACAGRGRQVVLADLCLEAPELHGAVGEENLEGLSDLFLFGASLERVTRTVRDHAFRFIPAGPFAPDPAEVLGHPHWERLISTFGRMGSTLLVYVNAGAPALGRLAQRVRSAVALVAPGEAQMAGAALPDGCRIVAALEEPAEAPAVATRLPAPAAHIRRSTEPDDFLDVPIFVRPRRSGSPWGAIGIAFVLVAALAGAGWFGFQWYSTRYGLPEWLAAAGIGGAADAPPAPPAALEQPQQTTESPPPQAGELPVPFSVAMEAHQDLAVAQERVLALRREEPGVQFFIAPIVVDGVLYYRVYAGPAADAASAEALMRRLVEAGHKTAIQAWAVRSTVWAYDLGDFDTWEAAQAREEELRRQGIPAYVLEIPNPSGPSHYRLYGGAYEGRGEAEVMGQLLREAGLPDSLIRRTGRPAA